MYFGNEVLQEAIYEQTVLNEMHISKEDLKDPKILEKVLEKSKKEAENKATAATVIPMLLGIAADVVLGIATGSILLSIVLFVPFIIGALVLAMNYIIDAMGSGAEIKDKNIEKLVKKTQDLKNKTLKLKDSKEKTEILDRCDKILESVKKHKSDEVNKKEKERIDNIKFRIKTIIQMSKGEKVPDDNPAEVYMDYVIADKLGIATPQQMEKAYIKCLMSSKSKEHILDIFFGGPEDIEKFTYEHEVDALDKKIKGTKQNAEICIIYAIDDTIFFYNPTDKKFAYGDYDPDTLTIDTSLYNLSKKMYSRSYKKADNPLDKKEIEEYKRIYEEMKK